MKIAVTAETDQGLDSLVAQHFGHAPYFVLAQLENGEIKTAEAIPNPYAEAHEPGQIPAFIHQQGAEVIISGGMGGRAIAFFEEMGVKTATGAAGTVREALRAYRQGTLPAAAACAESASHGHG